MGRLIAVANQKGGTGKTTLVVNLAAALGGLGHRVLVVDLDPQGDATTGFGIDLSESASISDVFDGVDLGDAVVSGVCSGVDVVRGSHALTEVEASLYQQKFRERFLKEALDGQIDAYDYVLIDSPPNLGNLTVNALVAADAILVPISMTDVNALKGFIQLTDTLAELARGGVIPEIAGLVRTNVADVRRNTFVTLNEELEQLNFRVFDAVLGARSCFHDSATIGIPLIIREPDHPQSEQVISLAQELIAIDAKKLASVGQ